MSVEVDAVKKIKMPAVRSSCDGHSPSSVKCSGISFLGFRTSRSAGRAEFFTYVGRVKKAGGNSECLRPETHLNR